MVRTSLRLCVCMVLELILSALLRKMASCRFACLCSKASSGLWPSALVMLLPMTVLDVLEHHRRHPHMANHHLHCYDDLASNTIRCPVQFFTLSFICVSCVCQFACVHVVYSVLCLAYTYVCSARPANKRSWPTHVEVQMCPLLSTSATWTHEPLTHGPSHA